jgi:hypothetical protein
VNLVYNAATNRWEADWNGFDSAAYFQVIYFAEGHNGDRSAPYPTLFGPPASPDAYDRFFGDDDPATTRNFFGVDAGTPPADGPRSAIWILR